MMINKKLSAIYFATALMTSGCAGNSSVDYITDTITTSVNISVSETDDETTTTIQTKQSLENMDKWTDQVITTDYKGDKIVYNIVADINYLHDRDSMSVYTCNVISDYDEQKKKEIVEKIAAGNVVYKFDDSYLTNEIIDLEIAENTKLRDEHKEMADFHNELIDYYTKLKVDAKEELTIADDYTGDKYLVYLDDIPYVIGFEKYSQVSETEKLYLKIEKCLYNNKKDLEAEMSRKETKEKVIEYLNQLGYECLFDSDDVDATVYYPYTWGDINEISNSFTFEQITRIMNISMMGTALSFDDMLIKLNGQDVPNIDAYVSKRGEIEFEIIKPLEIIKEEKNVTLLSLDNIVEIIKNELYENSSYKTNGSGELKYEELCLSYVGVGDGDKYYIIPAWRLTQYKGVEMYTSLYVNAIDGTIMNIYNIEVVRNE